MTEIKIATLNIASASKEKARRLLDGWLIPSSYDVCVLSETSEGQGTDDIISVFQAAGWQVFQRNTSAKDRGVAIVTRIKSTESTNYPSSDPAPGRSIVIELHTIPRIQIVGMYVPNRGNDLAKLDRKKKFLDCWLQYIVDNSLTPGQRILIGDLNVVPTGQRPMFLPQYQFEYDWYEKLTHAAGLYDAALKHGGRHESTWVAHSGEGYTYDHIMPGKNLLKHVVNFSYDHSTRKTSGLTDHSALILTVTVDDVQYLHQDRLREQKQSELF
jgi:exonuclease III